jgi:hypothetical protein
MVRDTDNALYVVAAKCHESVSLIPLLPPMIETFAAFGISGVPQAHHQRRARDG